MSEVEPLIGFHLQDLLAGVEVTSIFLAPVLALFLIFLPISGAGYFGLRQGGPMFIA